MQHGTAPISLPAGLVPSVGTALTLGTQGEQGNQMSEPEPRQTRRNGGETHANMTMAISNEMVRLYKERFGRGPTKARANWCGPDVLAVILEDTFTRAEHSLVAMGEHQRLRDLRLVVQYATVSEFCGVIERVTGRKVRAFVSGIDTEADGLAAELFVLHPAGYDGPSRAERKASNVAAAG